MQKKKQYKLEYIINCSPAILYQRIATPGGLTEWFADDVHIKNDLYKFFWDENQEHARLLGKKRPEFIRLQWEDDDDEEYYFELRIRVDSITKETALLIIDFAEDSEKEANIRLWDAQVNKLMHILGS